MVYFQNLPIRQKILSLLMMVNITTLLMVFGGFLIYDRWELRQNIIAQNGTIADLLAYNCTTALLFNDEKDARETLAVLKTKPSVISASVFTEKGTLLATYARTDQKKVCGISHEILKSGHYFKNGIFYYHKVVELAHKRIGTLCIQSEMHELTEITKYHAYIASLGLLLAIFFSFLLSIKMQKTVVRPILDLEAISNSVSQEGDYSVRGKKHGNDEIGSLVDAFNKMLHQIEQQDSALKQARKTAENATLEALQLAEGLRQANMKLENEIKIRKDVEKTLQKHREDLETRIWERTVTLHQTNQKLTGEISERMTAEKKIQDSLDEKVLLLGEIHHRVKNNLQVISSLLDLTRRRTLNPEAQMVLADARSKIYTMALVHSQLYRSESFSRIDMAVHIRKLLGSINQIYTNSHRRIHPIIECSHVFLSVTQAIPCALVLNEVIANVYKHAYPEDAKGECFISMTEVEKKRIHFCVRDEGVGIPESIDIEHSETLGLKLIRNLIRKQLKGDVRFESGKGTAVIAEFDIDHDDVLIHGGPELTPNGKFPSSEDTSQDT